MYRRSVPTLRRILGAFLWFEAAGSAAGILMYVTGVPTALSLVVGAAVAAFVYVDPTHLFWPTRRVMVADLKKVTATASTEQPEAVPAVR